MFARWLVALIVASALAWWQLAELPGAARAWTVALLVPLPALMIIEGRRLNELQSLPRRQAYISSIISLWALAGATYAITAFSGIAADAPAARLAIDARGLMLAAAVTAAGIAVLFLFKWAGMRETPLMSQLLPQSATERILFVGVSITAGICEEYIYRGFLLDALTQAASLPIALVLSSGAFGVAHAYQQPLGALRAGLLGALLAVPVLLTGSLLPSILAHALIDVLSGLWLARHLLR